MNEVKTDNGKTFIISAAIVAVAAISAVAIYNINDRILMSKNIDAAIAKGVDALSVRCSYTHSGDTMCVAYAASSKK
jgi:hypothetical protein